MLADHQNLSVSIPQQSLLAYSSSLKDGDGDPWAKGL